MEHINELYIAGYRGIQELKLKNLSRINLLVGKNNAGKTSILEAVELISNPGDLNQLIQTARGRDRATLTPRRASLLDSVIWTFPMELGGLPDEQIHTDINLKAYLNKKEVKYNLSCLDTTELVDMFKKADEGTETINDSESEFAVVRALDLTFDITIGGKVYKQKKTFLGSYAPFRKNPELSLLTTKMVTPVDHRLVPVSPKALTNSIVQGNKESLIKLLQDFDSSIEDIELLSPDDQTAVPYFKHHTKGYLPISIYGDGIRRVLTVATAVLQAQNGVLLIDEIETAIHAKMLKKFFEWLVDSCKTFNVQLIATTHSLEAIDGILSADKENLSDLTVYRLEKDENNNSTSSKRFIGEDIYELRFSMGQDVR
ncbi:ATP-binding protein [Saccharibacillus sp. CPCC 101409]|uniref:AAA family ATPase n=1 Tax=Saccharibacillus sp. CPCC 101409 TaxID=3058041 RepID=UPI00267400EF|nr:ATP-binding protein [Saccharibacillus sp. CPCC 101409]MDO3411641.1 ATP-binding protein [Saccharibacillus sp. CPCC 101409]